MINPVTVDLYVSLVVGIRVGLMQVLVDWNGMPRRTRG